MAKNAIKAGCPLIFMLLQTGTLPAQQYFYMGHVDTAIAWGGLQNTDSWYLLGNDTTSIINKNNQARENNASLLLTNCK